MAKVGRPPEVGPDGEIVAKSLVNVTVPTKLVSFLKANKINRSQLFVRIVTDLYLNQICRFCYGTKLHETLTGVKCDECEKWVSFKACLNCGSDYDMNEFKQAKGAMLPGPNPEYNHFSQSRTVEKGCKNCIPKKEMF